MPVSLPVGPGAPPPLEPTTAPSAGAPTPPPSPRASALTAAVDQRDTSAGAAGVPTSAGVQLPAPESASRAQPRQIGTIEREAARIAWQAMNRIDESVSLDLPDLGPVEGTLKLRPRTATSATDIDHPEWKSFEDAQHRAGNSVYWVTLDGELSLAGTLAEAPAGGRGDARLVTGLQVSITVPVIIPNRDRNSAPAVAGFFRQTYDRAIRGFPLDLDRATRLPGPWLAQIRGKYGVEADVRRGGERLDAGAVREVVIDVRRGAEGAGLTAQRTTQLVPKLDVAGDLALGGSDSTTLTLAGGQRATYFNVVQDDYRVSADVPAAAAAFRSLITLRDPPAGTDGIERVNHQETRTWSTTSRGKVTVAVGKSSLQAEASRARLAANDALVRDDELRKAAMQSGQVSWDHLAMSLAPTLGLELSTSAGALTATAAASRTVGRYEEVVVAHPRSLLGELGTSVKEMLQLPQEADDYASRTPGEQFRTLAIENRRAALHVGAGAAAGAAGTGSRVTADVGLEAGTEVIRDFKRYVLPNGHLLVDVRDYDAQRLDLGARLTARARLFARADAEALIEQFGLGALSGPLANLVSDYLKEVSLVASHVQTLQGRQYERLVRAELDLARADHRDVLERLTAGDTAAAAARLEQIALAGAPVDYVVEHREGGAHSQEIRQLVPGGGAIVVDREQPPGVTVQEARIGADRLVTSYSSESRSEPGASHKTSLTLRFGTSSYEVFSDEIFTGTTVEQAHLGREGAAGTEIVELQRDSAVLRAERKLLWADDKLSYYAVTFRERTRDAAGREQVSDPVSYVVADYASREWISSGNVEEFDAFLRAAGATVTFSKNGKRRWYRDVLSLGQRRFGKGEIRVRAWIPFAGLVQLGRAADDQIYQAAAIAAALADGSKQRALPAWATAHPELRETLRQWQTLPVPPPVTDDGADDRRDQLERDYRRIAGRHIWQDNSEADLQAFASVDRVKALRDSMRQTTEATLSESAVADAWREFGRAHGRDYWLLGVVRWTNLVQREPDAAGRREGVDDLFHLDAAELSSRTARRAAPEQPLPDHASQLERAKDRTTTGYRIKSL